MTPPDSHQNGHPAAEYADREDGVGRRSASIDNADSPGHFRASERTPLLATDLPADMLPHAAVKYKVISMCAIFLFVIDVGTFIMDAPMQQLMEDVICRDRFPDHPIGKDGVGDGRCKTAEVQQALANLKSMKMVAQMLCRLIVQVPYGIVADKFGRRPVLFMAILGIALVTTWCMLVLFLNDILPIWSMVPGAVLLFIGGGPSMASAMVYTMISDVTPVAERAPVFYQMQALVLVLNAVLSPVSAWLMAIDPWLPAWIGEAVSVLGVFVAFLIPETNTFRWKDNARAASEGDQPSDSLLSGRTGAPVAALPAAPDHGFLTQAWKTLQSDSMKVWRFILSSPHIMLLVLCEGLVKPIGLGMFMYALQYISARFSWNWSKATYAVSVSRIASCIMLLLILPFGSWVMTKRFGINPVKRDLQLARISSAFIILGSLLLAVAQVPWMLILALVVFGLSAGYSSQCRAIITALVEPHMLATVNTTMSMVETVLSLIGTPAIAWLLGKGLEKGGAWQGLPYFVFALVGLTVATALSLFKIPASLTHIEDRL